MTGMLVTNLDAQTITQKVCSGEEVSGPSAAQMSPDSILPGILCVHAQIASVVLIRLISV
jgi:hypothetical protein